MYWQNGRDGDRHGPTVGSERHNRTGCRAVDISVVCAVTYKKITRT